LQEAFKEKRERVDFFGEPVREVITLTLVSIFFFLSAFLPFINKDYIDSHRKIGYTIVILIPVVVVTIGFCFLFDENLLKFLIRGWITTIWAPIGVGIGYWILKRREKNKRVEKGNDRG